MVLLVYCSADLAVYLRPHMPSPPPTVDSNIQPTEELAQYARRVALEQRGI